MKRLCLLVSVVLSNNLSLAQLPDVVLSQIATNNASDKGVALSDSNFRRHHHGYGQDLLRLGNTYYAVARSGTGTVNRPFLFKSVNAGASWTTTEVSSNGIGSDLQFASIAMAYDFQNNFIHIVWTANGAGAFRHRTFDIDSGTFGTENVVSINMYPPVVIAATRAGKILAVACSNSDPSVIRYAVFTGTWSASADVPGSSEISGPYAASVAYSITDNNFYALVVKNAANNEATEYWQYNHGVDTWTDISGGNSPFGGTIATQPADAGRSNLAKLISDKNGELYAVMTAYGTPTQLLFNKTTNGTWGTAESYLSPLSGSYPNPTVGVLNDGSIYVTETNDGTPLIWKRTGVGSFSAQTVSWTGNGYHAITIGFEEEVISVAAGLKTWWRRRLLWR